jgi:hypothetical protein
MRWVFVFLVMMGSAFGEGIQGAPAEVVKEPVREKKMPRELRAEPVAAETPEPPKFEVRSPDEMVAAFFSKIEADEVEAAYEELTADTVVASRPEEAARLRDQTQAALDAYGPTRGYELLETERVGESLERRTYLLKGEVLPLRWKFYFYAGAGDWKLVDLRVDDDLVKTVDENGSVVE